MEIKLINKTPDFLRTIWAAGRTCHSSAPPQELFEGTKQERTRQFLQNYQR